MHKSLTLNDALFEHCTQSMDNALSAERYPSWKRSCSELKDSDLIYLGLLRCISQVDSGRHFLQTAEAVYGERVPHSTYFKSLKSPRRMSTLEAVELQSYKCHCATLTSQGIDYLASFPELSEYAVLAADGHFIEYAYHTEKGKNDKVYAAGFIYSLNKCCVPCEYISVRSWPLFKARQLMRDNIEFLQREPKSGASLGGAADKRYLMDH